MYLLMLLSLNLWSYKEGYNMFIQIPNYYASPVRTVSAKVELWEGSTLADTYNQYYGIKEFSIERVGESKFFGFGICQRFNIHLIDLERQIRITTADSFKVYFSSSADGESSDPFKTFPDYYVTEVHRNENTNELSVTAYDAIYKANTITVNSLDFASVVADETVSYTLEDFARACANALGVGFIIRPNLLESFSLSYETGANLEGTETIREALNAIAEATQTIYYITHDNDLIFKRLDIAGNVRYTIDKGKYFTLENKDNRRLATIVHATELGDNLSVSTSATGSTQYIRDNPFWNLRDDIASLLDTALVNIGGLTINQFDCEWRGTPLLEIGDKIALTTKNNDTVISYLLNDVLTYDGSLSQYTRWEYEDNDTETESNPNNIGDALKQTFARVDKVNKQIDLVVSQTEENKKLLSSLQLTTDNITASVEKIESNVSTSIGSVNEELAELSNKVSASVTAEDLAIEVQTQITNGVDKVVTSTGFVFNEEGLTVSKTGSEMETTITEDGMTVYRDEEAVLTANNTGVNATNLHATTYLIVGVNSRFEDFGDDRTGCFWIGGS
jgi:hypothetical protein